MDGGLSKKKGIEKTSGVHRLMRMDGGLSRTARL
jgi:hypothetical protein